jgi:hypothetical protein
MRKLILILMLCLTYGAVNAQKFVVTPEGLVSEPDNKDFVVIEFPGKTAAQLYAEANKYIQKIYANPDKVIKGKVENEYIRFDTHIGRLFYLNAGMGTKNYGSVDYTTQIDFKDGKVKLSFPSVDLTPENPGAKFDIGWKHEGMMNPGIYDKKGGVKQPDAKAEIEKYFNNIVAEITSYLSGAAAAKKEDW